MISAIGDTARRVFIAAAVLALGACGGGDSGDDRESSAVDDSPPPPPPPEGDGEALYNANCTGSGCHGDFATAPLWLAEQIENAIEQNRGGMGVLDLTAAEIQAIADALEGRL